MVSARETDPRRETHLVIAAVCLGLVALWVFSPDAFDRAMQEDGYVEWATALSYLAAALLALVAAVRASRPRLHAGSGAPAVARWFEVAVYLGLALFCVFVAGEELSWGQRLFGFAPPEAFMAGNEQQELEVHNMVLGSLLTDHGPTIAAVAYGLLLPLAAWGSRAAGRLKRPASRSWTSSLAPLITRAAPATDLVPWFVLVAILYEWYPVHLGGEAIEMLLGVLFAMDLTRRLHHAIAVPSRWLPPSPVTVAAIVMALSVATPMIADAAHEARSEQTVALATSELDRLGNDLASPGVIQAGVFATGGVHQRLYTLASRGLVRFGGSATFLGHRTSPAEDASPSSRHDRVGYFLDPWNSAYWLYFDPQARFVLVYSMGPNRKRDTVITSLTADRLRDARLDGDDLGVSIELVPEK